MDTTILDSISVADNSVSAELITIDRTTETEDITEGELVIRFEHIHKFGQFVMYFPVKQIVELLQETTKNHTLEEYTTTQLQQQTVTRQQLPRYDASWIPQSDHVVVYTLDEYSTECCTLCGETEKPEENWLYHINPQKTTPDGLIKPRYSIEEYRLHRDCLVGVLDCCRELVDRNYEQLVVQFV